MLFNSFEFTFFFLPVTVIIYYFLSRYLNHESSILWLVICSLFFYGWWNPVYLSLLIASVFFNYLIGHFILITPYSSGLRKGLLVIGIAGNLSLLGYFKYANFFVDTINTALQTSFHLEHIVLPLAISFFTFQQIAYLVDTHKGKVANIKILHYSLFVSFFPQLIAGPIVHHKEMMPQFASNKRLDAWQENISYGLLFLSIGLFKKIVLADSAGEISTPLFDQAANGVSLTFFTAWAAALGYTLQLYFDFSGYCDMAIGAARMFGIQLPLNFNAPYKATNIIDFWRRWHMTLSRFLRDYLYIPLGGNRKDKPRTYINIMITMLLGGMWHGAGWTFIVWGGLHGIYLILNHAWRYIRSQLLRQNLDKSTSLGRFLSIALTLFLVIIGWIFFRADSTSTAMSIIQGMAGLNGAKLPDVFSNISPPITLLLDLLNIEAIGGGGQVFYERWSTILLILPFLFGPTSNEIAAKVENHQWYLGCNKRTAYVLSIVFLIAVTNLNKHSEFLYFQF